MGSYAAVTLVGERLPPEPQIDGGFDGCQLRGLSVVWQGTSRDHPSTADCAQGAQSEKQQFTQRMIGYRQRLLRLLE